MAIRVRFLGGPILVASILGACTLPAEPPEVQVVAEADVAMDGGGNASVVATSGVVRGSERRLDVVAMRYLAAPEGGPGSWTSSPALTDYAPGIDWPEHPQVATDASGDTLVAWTYDGGVFAARQAAGGAGGGWSSPVRLGGTELNPSPPRLAMDGSGGGFVIWSTAGAQAARYAPGAGWGPPVELSSGVNTEVDIAMRPGPASMAVWQQGGQVYAARWSAAAGWQAPVRIDAASGRAEAPRVAMSGAGPDASAIVVWIEDDQVYANRQLAGSGWQGPEALGDASPFLDRSLDVGVDASGRAIVVWTGALDDDGRILARRFVPGAGWDAPVTFDARGEEARIAMAASGSAAVVWRDDAPAGQGAIRARRYRPGSGWGQAFTIEEHGEPRRPRVASDDAGAVAVWRSVIGGRSRLGRYVFGTPFARFSAAPEPAVQGRPVTFDAAGSFDEDGVIVSYEWDWDSNGTFDRLTSDPVTTFTFSSAGRRTVTLRVTDDAGLQATALAAIDVEAGLTPPPPTYELSLRLVAGPETVTVGEEVIYSLRVTKNPSTAPDPGIVVAFQVPDGWSFAGTTPDPPTHGAYEPDDGRWSFTMTTIHATLQVHGVPTSAGSYTASADIVDGMATGDEPGNNAAEVTIEVLP